MKKWFSGIEFLLIAFGFGIDACSALTAQAIQIENNLSREIKPIITFVAKRRDRVDVAQEDIRGKGFNLSDKRVQPFILSGEKISQIEFYLKSAETEPAKDGGMLLAVTDLNEQKILGQSHYVVLKDLKIPGWNRITCPVIGLIPGKAYHLIFSSVNESNSKNLILGCDRPGKNVAFRIKAPLSLPKWVRLIGKDQSRDFRVEPFNDMYDSSLVLRPDGTGNLNYRLEDFKTGNWVLNMQKVENGLIVGYNPNYFGYPCTWGNVILIEKIEFPLPVRKMTLHVNTLLQNVGDTVAGRDSLIQVFTSLNKELAWNGPIYEHDFKTTPGLKEADVPVAVSEVTTSCLIKYVLHPQGNMNNAFIGVNNGICIDLDTRSLLAAWPILKLGTNNFLIETEPSSDISEVEVLFNQPDNGHPFEIKREQKYGL